MTVRNEELKTLIEEQNHDREKMRLDLQNLQRRVGEFVDQYEVDMRGDKDLTNGNRGLVGEVREIKKYISENPSITWLMKNRTRATLVWMVVFISALIMVIEYVPRLLLLFGIPI